MSRRNRRFSSSDGEEFLEYLAECWREQMANETDDSENNSDDPETDSDDSVNDYDNPERYPSDMEVDPLDPDTTSEESATEEEGDATKPTPHVEQSPWLTILGRPKEDITWQPLDSVYKPPAVSFVRGTQTLPAPAISRSKKPMDYFQEYINDEFFVRAQEFTNKYALIHSKTQFEPCSLEEIRIVFAHHMLAGAFRETPFRLLYKMGCFDTMTKERFLSIRDNLHIVDTQVKDSTAKNTQELYKAQPIIDLVLKRLRSLPLPEHLYVDENCIPYNGRCVPFMIRKGRSLDRWAIKVFGLHGKNGMPYDVLIYEGDKTDIDKDLVDDVGFGSAVVLKLSERIPQDAVGHKLCFDKYYSSYKLFEMLKLRNILAIGKIKNIERFGEPLLPDRDQLKLKGRGSSAECVDAGGNVIVTRWLDNQVVNFGSNYIGVGAVTKYQRWDERAYKDIRLERPEVAKLFNQSQAGGELFDSFFDKYKISVKSKKAPLNIMMHFLDIALNAAWIEYKENCRKMGVKKSKIMRLWDFRMDVAGVLNTKAKAEPKEDDPQLALELKRTRNQTMPSDSVRYELADHWPGTEEKMPCMKENCKSMSIYYCRTCNIHLCIDKKNCYEKFHTRDSESK